MSGAITASVVVGAYSANKASKASKRGLAAAEAQNRLSLDEQARQYDIGQEQLRPYREAGEWGLGEYRGMLERDQLPKWGGFGLADLETDPGYKFRLQQGYQGLERMAARGGERFSGKLGIGLQDYGQRMAAQEFGAARQRSLQDYQLRRGEGLFRLGEFANLAATGQQATGRSSTLGQQYAGAVSNIHSNIGQTQIGQANAQAANIMGIGNTLTSGLAAYQYGQGYNQPSYNLDTSSYGAGWNTSQSEDLSDLENW